ncbi:helix-turn-helix domain-containing protein [Cellulophaga fucicola]|uniref:AraC-type DNA-binding protein n=1 Tax=Cellulophaga fucicola TaxID=76595 RepID=A0A1K1PBQ8_9FLAO|nr:AraC family transcriptional regulator [Cellulophaga fucicola]SFW45234.1 AraC-type DNA-binding protein [Cellulophaga fucicola]
MDIIEKLSKLIDKHYITQHTISFYEKELGLKPKYLSKLAKKNNTLPPCQLLLEKQIWHGKTLLKNTDKTVKEIASEMNFEDHFYFSKVFKRKTGQTPTEYRSSVK